MKKTKVILVTGFLGAGKTTVMRNLIEIAKNMPQNRIGVIINEFGKINVDAQTINDDGFEITQINNGSIFCKCLEGTFVDHIVKLKSYDLDYLFVESSGLSDPSNMESIMSHVNKLSNDAFLYSGIFCVVDAKYFPKLQKSLVTVEKQVLSASIILINKTDLVDASDLEKVVTSINKINPFARTITSVYGKLPEDILFSQINSITPKDINSYNTPGNRPDIILLKSSGIIDDDFIKDFIKHLGDDILRLKGFARFDDGIFHIEAVGNEYSSEKIQIEKSDTQLVVIPFPNISIRDKVTKYLSDYPGWNFEII